MSDKLRSRRSVNAEPAECGAAAHPSRDDGAARCTSLHRSLQRPDARQQNAAAAAYTMMSSPVLVPRPLKKFTPGITVSLGPPRHRAASRSNRCNESHTAVIERRSRPLIASGSRKKKKKKIGKINKNRKKLHKKVCKQKKKL